MIPSKLYSLTLFVILSYNVIASNNFDRDTIRINKLLSQSFLLQNSEPDSAYDIANSAAIASKKISYLKGLGQAYMRMGSIQSLYGKNDSALYYFQQVLGIRLKIKDYSGITGAYLQMSYAYNSLGKKDSAFSKLYSAIHYANISKDSARLANIYVSLGNLYTDYNDVESSFENYKIAEKIAISIRSPQELSLTFGGLGNYYFQIKNYDSAIGYFSKKNQLDKERGDLVAHAETKCNLGLCNENLNNNAQARYYYQSALIDFNNLGMREMESLVYFNLGSMYNNMKKPDSAIYYLEKALAIGRENNDMNRIASCYEYLSDAYVLKGDYANAYKNHLRYADVNDSILNSDKINSISEMQTKYDTEKKAQEISLLNEQNKRKIAERNIFITGTFLFLLLAIAILLGLLQTKKAKKVSENLLLNILPEEVADELKVKGSAEAKYFEEVSVLFTDFKDFTQISERLNPKELVELLHTCFKAFDEIITKYDIEKIKTIGDSYMCAGGLPVPNKNSAYAVVCAGLEIQSFINHLGAQRIREGKEPIKMRLGIHTGPVVAGIVGVKKYSYDIWGDTVNTASRMESSGEPGKVNISGTTYEFIKDQFRCSYRGKILAKHKGEIDMYFVEEIKSS